MVLFIFRSQHNFCMNRHHHIDDPQSKNTRCPVHLHITEAAQSIITNFWVGWIRFGNTSLGLTLLVEHGMVEESRVRDIITSFDGIFQLWEIGQSWGRNCYTLQLKILWGWGCSHYQNYFFSPRGLLGTDIGGCCEFCLSKSSFMFHNTEEHS